MGAPKARPVALATLDWLLSGPRSAVLVHLENYVNDGSPSGYSSVNAPPGEFVTSVDRPLSLPVIRPHDCEIIEQGRLSPDIPLDALVAHPLTAGLLRNADRDFDVLGELPAWSTAGGRTFLRADDMDGQGGFLKLHYPGVLGRVRRELPLEKAMAGFEVSAELERELAAGTVGGFALLREVGYRSALAGDGRSSWSFLERESRGFPAGRTEAVLVPAFALFSLDRSAPQDPPLLWQLHDSFARGSSAREWLLGTIIEPLIDTYLSATFGLGLMPEVNAQNLLFEVSADGVGRPVLRDMGRVEKLLHVRRERGLSGTFRSSPYKTLDLTLEQDGTQVRHSFSYDFKLGGYVLEPLLACLAGRASAELAAWRRAVAEVAAAKLKRYPIAEACFPVDHTYGHPRQMLTETRPYVELGKPVFR